MFPHAPKLGFTDDRGLTILTSKTRTKGRKGNFHRRNCTESHRMAGEGLELTPSGHNSDSGESSFDIIFPRFPDDVNDSQEQSQSQSSECYSIHIAISIIQFIAVRNSWCFTIYIDSSSVVLGPFPSKAIYLFPSAPACST